MNNSTRPIRLFRPGEAYQQGQLNRNKLEYGKIANQTNAFNLQNAQQNAPIVRQQEIAKFQKVLAEAEGQDLENMGVVATRMYKGLSAFAATNDPSQWPALVRVMQPLDPDNPVWKGPYNPDALKIEIDDAKLAADMVAEKVKWGPGKAAIGPDGQPTMMQQNQFGDERASPGGFKPLKKAPLVQVGPSGQTPTIPPVLLSGLSPPVAERAAAAYTAAGGGKDGLVAANKQIDAGTTQERRRSSGNILRTAFPKATPAELQQMQGTMDSAKNNQAGLKAATEVREEQRRLKKAKGFQERALILLDQILSNPELADVLGSFEGSDAGYVFGEKYRSDFESEAIADIEEAQNILTSDNLKLMSGVLSETDIKILTNLAGGALNRKRREVRFRSDVTKLIKTLSSQLVQTVDDQKTVPPSGRQDGKLHVDAQGNRAWVYPDGSFEEVK